MDFIDLQHEAIKKVTNLLKSFQEVDAVFLTGSHANGEESSFSDIDIGFIFSDSARPKREEIYKQVSDLYPSLCVLWLFNRDGLFLYANGVRLDLGFLTYKDLEDGDMVGVKILFDRQGNLRKMIFGLEPKLNQVQKPKWRDEDGDMIDWFFWMFRQAYCYIRRGETDNERSFRKLYAAQTSLSSIREKILEMKTYTSEQKYTPEGDKGFLDGFSSTFSDFNPENMRIVTRKLFEVFKAVAQEYCKKENRELPMDKIETMSRLFNEFDEVVK